MGMDNQKLIENFYKSFAACNIDGMLECYHDDVVFEDPAFGVLKGEDAKNMWRMLLKRSGGNLNIAYSNVKGTETGGSANWRAEYAYGPKKRKVINEISAQFEIENNAIVKHTDTFDLWKWSRQALGLPGYLLGWSPFMKKKINSTTNGLLEEFSKNN